MLVLEISLRQEGVGEWSQGFLHVDLDSALLQLDEQLRELDADDSLAWVVVCRETGEVHAHGSASGPNWLTTN